MSKSVASSRRITAEANVVFPSNRQQLGSLAQAGGASAGAVAVMSGVAARALAAQVSDSEAIQKRSIATPSLVRVRENCNGSAASLATQIETPPTCIPALP